MSSFFYESSSEEPMLSEELVEHDEELSLPAKIIFAFLLDVTRFILESHLHSGMMDLLGVHLTLMVVVSV